MNRHVFILCVITSLLCGCGTFTWLGPADGDVPLGQRKGEVAGNADAAAPAGKEERKEHK